MANINFGDLPKGIDFYNPNWSSNYDVNSVFPGQGGGIVSVNDGHGHFLSLPTEFVANQNAKYGNHSGAPGGGSFANRLASLGSSSQAAPAPTVNGMSFADYLNQIGVHVPGSTGNPSTDPNNAVAQIMAGFSTPSVGGIGGFIGGLMDMSGRSRFAPRSHFNTQPPPLPGDIQNLMPYYQQFLHMNDTGGNQFGMPQPGQYQSGNYQF